MIYQKVTVPNLYSSIKKLIHTCAFIYSLSSNRQVDILNFTRLLCKFSFHHTTKNENLRSHVFQWRRRDYETLFLFFFSLFFICPKLRKDKRNRYVGMKRRNLARHNLAALINARCISLLHVSFVVFPYFGENGRAIRRSLK